MINVGRALTIVCAAFLWMLSIGSFITTVLSFMGAVSFIKDMAHEKQDFERRSDRDMAIIFGFAGVVIGVFTALLVWASLAITRGI